MGDFVSVSDYIPRDIWSSKKILLHWIISSTNYVPWNDCAPRKDILLLRNLSRGKIVTPGNILATKWLCAMGRFCPLEVLSPNVNYVPRGHFAPLKYFLLFQFLYRGKILCPGEISSYWHKCSGEYAPREDIEMRGDWRWGDYEAHSKFHLR